MVLRGHGITLRGNRLDGRDARTANDTSSASRPLRYARSVGYRLCRKLRPIQIAPDWN